MRFPDAERPDAPGGKLHHARCRACRDIIGVYEPMVHLMQGLVRRTSIAAEPGVATAGGELYHADCYMRVGRHGPAEID